MIIQNHYNQLNKQMIEIYEIGTEVIFSDMMGKITCSTIRQNSVVYEVSYFVSGKHELIWLYDFEFTTVDNHKKTKVGFK